MATLKHLSSKNADYGVAEQYLTFEHDEFTGKPILDENGRLVPRQDYRISSLNCGEEDFAVACMRANLRYGKNQQREDVKSHHYILSFDPRDGPDHGLTMDKAQALGERFCAEQFPGHQALVCTHPERIGELNGIFKRLYEDSVSGRITDERFMELSTDYEQEQATLKARAAELQAELGQAQEAAVNVEKFMAVVRKYTSFEELTPTLLREFVEKIVVHECWKDEQGTRHQDIEIYYSFVGKVDLPDD